jgi:hypothetical protein
MSNATKVSRSSQSLAAIKSIDIVFPLTPLVSETGAQASKEATKRAMDAGTFNGGL